MGCPGLKDSWLLGACMGLSFLVPCPGWLCYRGLQHVSQLPNCAFPPCLQLKSFHNELLTQLEQKVELDSRYLSVSTACPCLCLEICLLDGLPP